MPPWEEWAFFELAALSPERPCIEPMNFHRKCRMEIKDWFLSCRVRRQLGLTTRTEV